MKNKKKKYATILACLASAAVAISVLLFNSNTSFNVFSQNEPYAIVFNSFRNKLFSDTGSTAYSGDSDVFTNAGNNITIHYDDLMGLSNTWHVVKNGGSFYNKTAIHGLERVSLSFKTDSKSFQLIWSPDSNFENYSSYDFVTSTSSNIVFDFNEECPTYFKFINTSGSNINISNISLNFSCQNFFPVLNVESEDEIMGTVSGGGTKHNDEEVTIVASPNSGYKFVGWYQNDVLVSTIPSYTFTIGNIDLTYVARFTYESYDLVVQSESSQKGSVSDSTGSYDYLTQITVEAIANEGYTFQGWYKDSSLVSTDNPYIFNMPFSDTIYTAKFSTNSYELSLINTNPDLGSITGSGTFLFGSCVTLTATANTGVSFIGWYDSDNNIISSLSSYSFNMPHEDIEYTAKFAWTPYKVNVEVNDDSMGIITGDGSYIYDQKVTLVALPYEHHSFFGWYLNNELITREPTYSFDMPASNVNLEAKFVINHSLFIFSDDETKGSVSYPSEYGEGLEVTIIANAEIGFAFDYWYDEDLNEVSYDREYTFVMPNHDISLFASFTTGYTLTLACNDSNSGTISSGGQYKAGQSVTITANATYGFNGWYDEYNNLIATQAIFTFNMPSSNYYLIAMFVIQEEWNIAHGVIPTISGDGKTITYGLYPQTFVDDSSLVSVLDSLTTQETNGWYLYDNNYYAKVSASPYKSGYKFDKNISITKGRTYWFKCEPIVWNILSYSNGEYYILSSVLLDAQGYAYSSNSYVNSKIRKWINNDFYNSAFALNDEYILSTIINSDSEINDKVFLPSYSDYINTGYGFSSSASSSNTRYCKTTDWARARGARLYSQSDVVANNGYYWTRSYNGGTSIYAWIVDYSGYLSTIYVNNSGYCARPAITICIS